MTGDMSREVYPFRRDGRPVVLLTRREAQALQQVLDERVAEAPDDETDLGRARRVLRLQLSWLDQTVLAS